MNDGPGSKGEAKDEQGNDQASRGTVMIPAPTIGLQSPESAQVQLASAVVQSRYAVYPAAAHPTRPDYDPAQYQADLNKVIGVLAQQQRPSPWMIASQIELWIFSLAAVLTLVLSLLIPGRLGRRPLPAPLVERLQLHGDHL